MDSGTRALMTRRIAAKARRRSDGLRAVQQPNGASDFGGDSGTDFGGDRRSVGLSAFRVRRVRGGLIATYPESSPRRKRSALMTTVSSGRSTSMAIFRSWCRSCARYR